MRIALALLAAEAPAPARLAELAALLDTELIIACAGPRTAWGSASSVRPLQAGADHPLALLHAALLLARAEALVALAGEDPLPPAALLRALATHPARGNVLLPARAPLRPLPGRYRRGCLGALRRALLEGERDLGAVVRSLHATIVDEHALGAGTPS